MRHIRESMRQIGLFIGLFIATSSRGVLEGGFICAL